ncbi:Lrp/AsnC family transcriptional regulator [Saccharopolyspora sp. CA-218241]|uniref:Lrp/AsnC family transcriptional regulator n=1 Tax=Saccharopolyspora sp. CA-218241 TaxID=3240027 RepID=UPI003D961D25
MTGAALVDELDLALIGALQQAPRAPLRALADALGSSASTIGRRWQRLHDDRLLRVIGQLDWNLVSETRPRHVWITTAPGRSPEVARRVAALPEVQYVALTSGRADVYCTAHPGNRAAARDLLTRRIPAVGGVRDTRSDLVLRAVGRADAWCGAPVPDPVRAALAAHRRADPPSPAVAFESLSEPERRAAALLHGNARLTSSDLARELGVSQSSAHRLLGGLLERRVVRPRVEVEPAVLGFQVEAVVALATEPGTTAEVGRALGNHPSARYVSVVAGSATVIHQGVFGDEDALADFLSDDLAGLPGIRSTEVSVVLDVLRRYWIDRDGVRLGEARIPLRGTAPG